MEPLVAVLRRFRARLAGDDPGADRHFTTSTARLRSLELPIERLDTQRWLERVEALEPGTTAEVGV